MMASRAAPYETRGPHGDSGQREKQPYGDRALEPFWHVGGRALYVYDRARDYTVPASDAEVREVTVRGETYPVTPAAGRSAFVLPTIERAGTSSTSMASAELP